MSGFTTENPELSVVIPARNEAGNIEATVRDLYAVLRAAGITHEVLVLDDNSTDNTGVVLRALAAEVPGLRVVTRGPPGGYGLAVRDGLDAARGWAVAVYMADASDDPRDLVRFLEAMKRHNVDCVFGTRFDPRSRVVDYPLPKLVLNRAANRFISTLFGLDYNDVTNAFKMFRRSTLEGLKPCLSHHFNLTVELPLKAIVRGYTYVVLPNDWFNRKHGESKLRIKEMGSRYMFVVLYCLIEKWFGAGDYDKRSTP